jgi:hypothetical protein
MRITKLLLIISIVIISMHSAYAISIGISPGRVSFNDLLQDGYAERAVKITTNSDEVLNGHFNVYGDIKDWLSFDPESAEFSLSRGEPYLLKIIIQPPPDVRNGNYTGSVEFITDTVGGVSGRAGGVIKAAVTLIIEAEVSGTEIIECRAGGFSFKDAEIDFPIEFGLKVINDGNVRLKPTITIDVWDQQQEELLLSETVLGDEVFPTTEKSMFKRIANKLGVGQYWVNLRVEECNAEDTLTFSVVEKGGIIDKGELVSISNKPWANVDETVEIIATFMNSGERSVNAKFKGNIRLEDEIVKVIETEEVIVPSGEKADFSIFFVPKQQGRYMTSGRVVYNKKLTYEKGSVLNVVPADEVAAEKEKFPLLPLIIYIIIIITILFILRKIVKDRKKKRNF